MALSFKIDENLPYEVAQLLREAGHLVSTVLEEGLGGAPDHAVAEVCLREQRVLATLDAGFADIRAYPPSKHPGLIVFRLRRQEKSHIVEALARVLQTLESETVAGRLWIVEERRIRIRA